MTLLDLSVSPIAGGVVSTAGSMLAALNASETARVSGDAGP